MRSILDIIESPADVRRLSPDALPGLCAEIRDALIQAVPVTGGHLGPNLGFIEATVALHYVFNTPVDKLVFDVSHQCYTHKMLTGRKAAYLAPERYNTYTGFTNPGESEYDLFRAGHTSQAVSLALGLAKARDLLGEDHNVIAVLGDGALSGGEAFEGLDNAATIGSNFIVVFNDNQMSIAPNSGGVYGNLDQLRQTQGAAAENFFRTLGLDYCYVEEGNDVLALVEAFEAVRDIDHPIVVHIHTLKGKGLPWAEENPEAAHMVPAAQAKAQPAAQTYQQITRDYLSEKLKADRSVVVVNAGAPSGVGLTPEFRAQCGSQFVDTGITEQHAVAFSAGLARGGAKPVFMVMASFLQRSFDQLVQEMGLNGSPATVLVFGAGFYDIDATHAGTLDLVMTSNIPGITCLAPATKAEYLSMLDWSIDQMERPVVIRVPERVIEGENGFVPDRPCGWHCVRRGSRVAFLSVGSTLELALDAADLLEERDGIRASVVEALNYSSFDEPLLDKLLYDHDVVVTLEAGILCGGFGEKVARYYGMTPMRVNCYGGKKELLDRVPTEEFFVMYHFTSEDIVADLEAMGYWVTQASGSKVSLATRHVMQANKSKNTKPELLMRRALREAGLPGYRLHWKKCPGRPDVCYPGRKVAIFVNGCFWHRCPHCNLPMPKSNVEFWEAKFARNRARDARNHAELVAAGWTVLVVWECALKRGRFDATVSRVVREIELVSVGLFPTGRVVEVGYLKPWQHRVAWRRRHR